MNNTTGWHWLSGRASGWDTAEGPDSAAIYGREMIRGSGSQRRHSGCNQRHNRGPW